MAVIAAKCASALGQSLTWLEHLMPRVTLHRATGRPVTMMSQREPGGKSPFRDITPPAFPSPESPRMRAQAPGMVAEQRERDETPEGPTWQATSASIAAQKPNFNGFGTPGSSGSRGPLSRPDSRGPRRPG